MMTRNEMVQELEIAAPRPRVFRALTDARELERWWTTTAESQPRPGGSFRYEWTFPDAPERDHVQQGQYVAFQEGEKVSYPWKVGQAATRVDFTLRDSGSGTAVRLEHSGWGEGMDKAYEMHDQGWAFFLGNLKTFLEEGLDRRAETTGMRVVA